MNAHYHVIKVDGSCVTVRKCNRCAHDRQCPVDGPTDTFDVELKNAARVLPIGGPHACYGFTINNDLPVPTICGCSSIFTPDKVLDTKAMLADAIIALGIRHSKTNMTKAIKLLTALKSTASSFAQEKVVQDVFDDVSLTEEIRNNLRDANGWFVKCPSMRAVGKGLFCMGFHDRAKVVATLNDCSNASAGEDWFLGFGYGVAGDHVEDFRSLYAQYRKRDSDFLEYIKDVALEDANAFFSADTRPVALRALGELNREFFSQFCAPTPDDQVPDLARADLAKTLADDEKNIDGARVMCVGGELVFATTVALCRTLIELTKLGLLRFTKETLVVKRKARLFDTESTLQSVRGNFVDEVHVMCATKRICLGFDTTGTGKTDIETLKTRFMQVTGTAVTGEASVFVRDAHMLRCGQLSHVLWRAAARAVFSELVVTTRFEYDSVYMGPVGKFLAALNPTVCDTLGPDVLMGKPSVASLDIENLAAFTGVCIVPTAQDAMHGDGNATFVEGTHLFIVRPPVFGRAVKHVTSKNVIVALAMDSKEVVVPLHHLDGKNVYASLKTAARGVLVPVSALIFQRKKIAICNVKATVFVPRCFSSSQRADLIDGAKAFFLSVSIVAVDSYTQKTVDLGPVKRVVEAMKLKYP